MRLGGFRGVVAYSPQQYWLPYRYLNVRQRRSLRYAFGRVCLAPRTDYGGGLARWSDSVVSLVSVAFPAYWVEGQCLNFMYQTG